jgi:hypothetical protein
MSKSDPETDSGNYEPLAVIGDPAAANLLGALLRSEGIPVRMHGETYGPYPVSVGGLAQVEVWVAADRLADARAILEASRSDPED